MPEFLAAPMHAIFPIPLPFLIVIAGVAAGLIGLGMGYLTLRLRGVFFAIATLGAGGRAGNLHRQLVLLSAARAAPMSFRPMRCRFSVPMFSSCLR